ncbi:AbrB/MazE/SpoVT family DNA-binding domain-containing protein [Eisenibacter elegans]|jgi:antitoxin MazE|uniref:AbrB/MazE/SpoVT family DNA-binding domain-containing protein n=1 Tax=Eisenibacter elegans TaxID=997 RepID=UPI000428F705|nr:AbrB/MazE/SpoVT family DNA-binding domain-containing protein [Eisenibacter elegans]
MQVSVIQVGNSKGIRLSKTLLEKYQITDKIELVLENDYIILKPVVEPRKNWEEAFAKMHRNGDDKLFIDSVFEDENWC